MVKILQTIDGFLYDVVLWVVLIPKTIVKIIIAPAWSDSYVRSELAKDAAQRYEAYMPPIIFFITTGILPLLAVGRFTCLCPDGILVRFNKLPIESNILVLALVYTSPPLIYSLVILKYKRQSIDRNSLRPVFHTQCLLWAVYYLLGMPAYSFYVWEAGDPTLEISKVSDKGPAILILPVILLIVVIWFFYAEYKVILRELHTQLRSFGITLLCYIISALVLRLMFYLIMKWVP